MSGGSTDRSPPTQWFKHPIRAVVRRITDYFQAPACDTRSAEVLEREKYVLWHPKTGLFHRIYIIIPVIVAQMCIGSLYSWSIFNKYNDTHVWGEPGTNAKVFMICVAFYGFCGCMVGPWIARAGPHAALRRALLTSPLGYLLASLGCRLASFPLVLLGFAGLHGFGAAHVYLSTTSMLQQHFVEMKGFAAGLGVMGFGLGSYVWTNVGKMLLDPRGPYQFEPYQVLAVFGGIFAVLLSICLPFMRMPPPGWEPPPLEVSPTAGWCTTFMQKLRRFASHPNHKEKIYDKDYTFSEALTQQEFWLLAVVMFGISMPGICFLSSAADMVQNTFDYDSDYAAFITSMLNLMNFTGRFGWGLVTDKIGRKTFFVASTAVQAVAVGIMTYWIKDRQFYLWLISFLLIGSLYGGSFGVLPAFVSDMFGPRISAATHGAMIFVWAIASIVGINIFTAITAANVAIVDGVKVPTPEAYIVNAQWLMWPPVLSFVAVLLLNVRKRDRILRKENRDFRVRCVSFLCVSSPCRLLGPAAQETEWLQHEENLKSREIEFVLPSATAFNLPGTNYGSIAETPSEAQNLDKAKGHGERADPIDYEALPYVQPVSTIKGYTKVADDD